jgi:hypothetical protein
MNYLGEKNILITDLTIDDPSRGGEEHLRYGLPDLLDAYGPVRSFSDLPAVLGCLTNNVAIFNAFPDEATGGPGYVTIPMGVTAFDQNRDPGVWPLEVTAHFDASLF